MAHINYSRATLRVFGDALDPNEVTRLLGAEPSESQVKGDRLVGRKTGRVRIAETGSWRLHASVREPADLDDQVREILHQITENLSVWADLSQRFEIDLFCGLFMENSNEGLFLSPLTLSSLGQRGIELALDIYGP
jgi:hypothetical protein